MYLTLKELCYRTSQQWLNLRRATRRRDEHVIVSCFCLEVPVSRHFSSDSTLTAAREFRRVIHERSCVRSRLWKRNLRTMMFRSYRRRSRRRFQVHVIFAACYLT